MIFQEAKSLFEIYNNEKIDIYHEQHGEVLDVWYSGLMEDVFTIIFEKEGDLMYLNFPKKQLPEYIPEYLFISSLLEFSLSIGRVEEIFLKHTSKKIKM